MRRLLPLLFLFLSCTPSDRCEPGAEACRDGKASLCAPNQAWVVVVDCDALGPG